MKKGLILSPIQTTEKYDKKSIWVFERFNEKSGAVTLVSARCTEEKPKVLTIQYDEFALNFKDSRDVLVSGEEGYAKAFRINLKIKLDGE